MISYIVTWLVVLGGALGGAFRPVVGVAAFYWLSVLRPEILWFYAFGSSGGNAFSKLVAIGALIGWVLTGRVQQVARLGVAAAPVIGLVVFLLSGLLSTVVWAVDPAYAWENLTIQLKIGLMALIAITACTQLADIKFILGMLLFALGYFAWELNLAWVKFYRIPTNLLSLHGDNNNISLLMVVTVPLGLITALLYRKSVVKALAIVAAFAALHAILFLESRGAYVGIATVLAVFFISALRIAEMRRHAILGALACLAFVLVFAGEAVVEEWNSIFVEEEERDSSAQSRIELAKAGWDMMLNNPLGLGPRQEQREIHKYGFEEGKLLHNLYVQVGADYGFIGLFGYLTYFVGAVRAAFRLARREVLDETDRQVSVLGFGLGVALIGFLVSGVFLSCERIEIGVIIASIALALARVAVEIDGPPAEALGDS